MTIFTPDPIPENPLAELVGEGKKYQNVEDLAKAYFHADRTIAQRNQEAEQLRTDLQARMSVEEMLAKISGNAPTPAPVTPEAHQPAKPAAETPDVAELVRLELAKLNTTQTIQNNVATVTQKLVAKFGSEEAANRAVNAKAQELGLPMEFLQEVATKSPRAFFTTLGIEDAPTAPPARPTQGDVNPNAAVSHTVKPGTYSFYENLRKTSPTTYFSPKVQNQMHKDALANPESFFKT